MHLGALVDMVESGFADRTLLSDGDRRLSGAEVAALARQAASALADRTALVYAGENHPFLPVAVFAAAVADVPFVPLNYRLEDDQLAALVADHPGAAVLADARTRERLATGTGDVATLDHWLTAAEELPVAPPQEHDEDDVAVVLYTSGTTSAPKAALLRHRHLMAYLLGTVEFGSATDVEAALIAVPPYHVAGIANMLTNTFAGRRLVYLRAFDPAAWLDTVRTAGVTNAMVVPTMLARIVATLDGKPADVPTLRTLSYGGAKLATDVLCRALELFGDTGFVNAYGLTETASTIAVLGPDDHRAALTSDDPEVRRRLGAAGRVLPSVDLEVRDEAGAVLPTGAVGMIYVRGEQIAGEYASGSLLDEDGWFCTRDHGWVDDDGYLFVAGRADDTIIRGGENIAPAEIEDVLLRHPAVDQACVVGVPDDEWGQRIVAAVVTEPGHSVTADALQALVRSELRGSRTPEQIVFRDELPYTDTGKLLRRAVAVELVDVLTTH